MECDFGDALAHLRGRKGAAGFFFDRSHGHVLDAARNDAIKWSKIAADVEGEAMHRDPMANAHANGRDLAIFNPDAGQARTCLR